MWLGRGLLLLPHARMAQHTRPCRQAVAQHACGVTRLLVRLLSSDACLQPADVTTLRINASPRNHATSLLHLYAAAMHNKCCRPVKVLRRCIHAGAKNHAHLIGNLSALLPRTSISSVAANCPGCCGSTDSSSSAPLSAATWPRSGDTVSCGFGTTCMHCASCSVHSV